jgi:hypothetical protein
MYNRMVPCPPGLPRKHRLFENIAAKAIVSFCSHVARESCRSLRTELNEPNHIESSIYAVTIDLVLPDVGLL